MKKLIIIAIFIFGLICGMAIHYEFVYKPFEKEAIQTIKENIKVLDTLTLKVKDMMK